MKDTTKSVGEIIEIPVEDIAPSPHQPRTNFDEDSTAGLAASIEAFSQIHPVIVTPTEAGFQLLDGERRLRACRALGQVSIKAILVHEGNPDTLALVANCQQEDIGPVDLAEALHKLRQVHDYTQDDLSKIIGKSRPSVSKILKIAALSSGLTETDRSTLNAASLSPVMELALAAPEQRAELLERIKAKAPVSELRELRKDHVNNAAGKSSNQGSGAGHPKGKSGKSALPTDALFKAGEKFKQVLAQTRPGDLDVGSQRTLLSIQESIDVHIRKLTDGERFGALDREEERLAPRDEARAGEDWE